MANKFTEKQILFMREIGVKNIKDIDEVEDKVSDFLMCHGFDKNYNPTAKGLLCESILDGIA